MSANVTLSPGFIAWYAIYPRKQSKGDAWKAWGQVGAEKISDEIIKATKKYQFADEQKYIKLPASWLRAWCWEDVQVDGNNADTASLADALR
jgi:hypothetical protein